MVAPVACTGEKFPASLSFSKKLTPLAMLLADPPSARLAIITPFSAACVDVGLPSSATAPLNFGLSRSFSEVMVPNILATPPGRRPKPGRGYQAVHQPMPARHKLATSR